MDFQLNTDDVFKKRADGLAVDSRVDSISCVDLANLIEQALRETCNGRKYAGLSIAEVK